MHYRDQVAEGYTTRLPFMGSWCDHEAHNSASWILEPMITREKPQKNARMIYGSSIMLTSECAYFPSSS